MKAIYEPKGAAREYGELAVNLYTGCNHGCLYCYAPKVLRMSREEFNNPKPRPGILEALTKEAPKYKGRTIFLCFTCDPYMWGDTWATRGAIKILKAAGCHVKILTKGGTRAIPDFYLLDRNDEFGVTLVFTNLNDLNKWEPDAATVSHRMASLYQAKQDGIKTWASLEPVIDPTQTLALIDITHHDVDFYAVGKLNHHPLAKTIDWRKFHDDVVTKLEGYGKKYVIKQALKEAAGE